MISIHDAESWFVRLDSVRLEKPNSANPSNHQKRARTLRQSWTHTKADSRVCACVCFCVIGRLTNTFSQRTDSTHEFNWKLWAFRTRRAPLGLKTPPPAHPPFPAVTTLEKIAPPRGKHCSQTFRTTLFWSGSALPLRKSCRCPCKFFRLQVKQTLYNLQHNCVKIRPQARTKCGPFRWFSTASMMRQIQICLFWGFRRQKVGVAEDWGPALPTSTVSWRLELSHSQTKLLLFWL